ncbi:MAG: hypothetical protein AAB592_00680 [Patescibacteria group bacterium]
MRIRHVYVALPLLAFIIAGTTMLFGVAPAGEELTASTLESSSAEELLAPSDVMGALLIDENILEGAGRRIIEALDKYEAEAGDDGLVSEKEILKNLNPEISTSARRQIEKILKLIFETYTRESIESATIQIE